MHCVWGVQVRLAVLKYVKPGTIPDVSEAVEALFERDIAPQLDPTIFNSPDDFRRDYLYSAEISTVLLKHETSLRVLFNSISRIAKPSGSKKLGLLLGVSEWKGLVRRLELIDHDLTDRDCTLCFICSRMKVIDGGSDKGFVKESSLPFEGFLEAICRAALLKAWPTPAEVEESGLADAGEFVRFLRRDDPARHKAMCEERAVVWGALPSTPPPECIENMISLLIQIIEEQLYGETASKTKNKKKGLGADMQLSTNEMAKWNTLWKEAGGFA